MLITSLGSCSIHMQGTLGLHITARTPPCALPHTAACALPHTTALPHTAKLSNNSHNNKRTAAHSRAHYTNCAQTSILRTAPHYYTHTAARAAAHSRLNCCTLLHYRLPHSTATTCHANCHTLPSELLPHTASTAALPDSCTAARTAAHCRTSKKPNNPYVNTYQFTRIHINSHKFT